jgi:hypothetical protein
MERNLPKPKTQYNKSLLKIPSFFKVASFFSKDLFGRLFIFQNERLEIMCFTHVTAQSYRLTVFELYRITALMLPYQPLSAVSLQGSMSITGQYAAYGDISN